MVTGTYNASSKSAMLTVTAGSNSTGPAGYWKLDDGSGTTVSDASGNGNNGAIVGSPAWTTGVSAGALQLDGTSYVTIPSSSTLAINGNAISFGAWYYHTSSADGFILGKTVSDYTYMMELNQGAQQFMVYLQVGGQLKTLGFPNSVPNGLAQYVNSWVHFFVTYDGATIHAYINGIEVANQPASGAITSNSDAFAIGARGGDGSWTRFNSKVDEVRVYNRALSAQEVAVLAGVASAPPPPPPAPVISSFTVSPNSVVAGSSGTLAWTVSNATTLSIDQGVGVVTGLTSKSVSPAATTTYTLTATNAGGSTTAKATLTVTSPPPPVISSFTVSPNSVAAGSSGTLAWTVSNATTLSIDQGVGVVTGLTSKSVSPAATTTYTLTATSAGGSVTAKTTLTVTSPPPSLSGLTCTPTSITAPGSTVCAVTLSAAAPSSGASVTASGSSSMLTVPSPVSIPAGSATASFTVLVGSASANQTASVTAALNGGAQSANLTIVAPAVVLSSLSCSPTSMPSGSSSTCSVTMSAPAPSAGIGVNLSSSGSAVAVPAAVTVPANSTTASFTAAAASVTTQQTVSVTAAAGSVSKSLSLTVTPPTPPNSSINSGLAGYWRFDEGSGSTTIDSSGNGNTGTLMGGPAWTTGISGGALQFNGSNYVSVPNSSSLSIGGSAISFGAMYYHTSTSDGFLLGKIGSNYTYGLAIDNSAQQFIVYLKTGNLRSTVKALKFPASVPNGLESYQNKWIQFFVTYDGATLRAYINGVEAANMPASGGVFTTKDNFAIGSRGDESWTKFNGTIDGVRVYNRALSAQEVLTLYNAGASPSNY
jgi:hypothetical protein